MATVSDPLSSVLEAKTAADLASHLGLATVGDLLRHYPRRYAERGAMTSLRGLEVGEHVTVLARVAKVSSREMKNRPGTLQELIITDGHGEVRCTFFSQRWLPKRMPVGTVALFAGQVSVFNKVLQLTHPDYRALTGVEDTADAAEELADLARPMLPIYPATAKLASWDISSAVRKVLAVLDLQEDPLPEALRSELGLLELGEALRLIHRPDTADDVTAAEARLRFDEAMALQLVLAGRRVVDSGRTAPACPTRGDGVAAAFDAQLPFTLTEGQKQVGAELAADLARSHPMSRLLQGEVGSGKTVVALRAMLDVVDSGRQAAMLAPTEVLAAQHARSLSMLLGQLGRAGELGSPEQATRVRLLTGSMPTAIKRAALLDIVTGEAGIVIGTHALIQDTVSFFDLGLVVVDEQHRFGVEQRDRLRDKGRDGATPHLLVMTATPIPRTVALTVFGDLAVSTLRELPAGRAPITTSVVPETEKPTWLDRAWIRVVEEVAAGRQAYVVCSRIGEDDADQNADQNYNGSAQGGGGQEEETKEENPTRPVLELAEELAAGPLAGVRLEVLHGRMAGEDKDAVMRAFAAGEIDVLVATTVIEVGVDVANATTMVVMDAERFGVSQLHQLRGRVGRGGHPGLCLLHTTARDGAPSRRRLDAVARTTDGFELAQLDLEQRREGDVLGVAQSGVRSTLRKLSLLRDGDVIESARRAAGEVIATDPTLTRHPGLAAMVSSALDPGKVDYLQKA
ncbi:MAG: ATP-dependent DNA helicase RecG [Mycobacteriaceae bacterium]